MNGILYLQSEYNFLENLIKLEDLVKHAKNGGYDFVALTDTNMHGYYQLSKLSKKYNIKPVYGLKVMTYINLYETGFLIYIKSEIGYKNLLKISNIMGTEDNHIKLEDLIKHQEGLIFITSGYDSIIDKLIFKKNYEEAVSILKEFKEKFKEFYLGLTLSNSDYKSIIASQLEEISNIYRVDMLPIHRTCYLNNEDRNYFETLVKIKDVKSLTLKEDDLSFKTVDELNYLFNDYKNVFLNINKIIKKINFEFKLPKFNMPVLEKKGKSSGALLTELATKGLNERIKKNNIKNRKAYYDRLKYELDIIDNLGFSDYFLIVQDFVNYAKNNDILVGPGRGSSAGSLVSWALKITEIDSLKYGLMFERFLNPERKTMPDIDIDFPDNRRDEVINYCLKKYGKNHIASIITFDTFKEKSSIRDIAKTLGYTSYQENNIVKSITNNIYDKNSDEIKYIINCSKKIIGLPRHTGTHAAGIIISKNDLLNVIPLTKGSYENIYQTQWDSTTLEEIGLLKIDFLGLSNLKIIKRTVDLINKDFKEFKLQDIKLDDKKTFELLTSSNTNGIFQLESPGMRKVLRELKPTSFEDIVAVLALYRPGPIDNIKTFIERKRGKRFNYLHQDLEPILKDTYGIIVYQEQIMKIANKFAGYSLADADLLRRGISSKDTQLLKKEEQNFIKASVKKGNSKELAKKIYDYIYKFADYGFNRAHSVSYALVSYKMAYLKANYFKYFAKAILENSRGNDKTTELYLKELLRQGFNVEPPYINSCDDTYIFNKNNIILPISIIKGIGTETTRKFLEERKKKKFSSYTDFKLRVKGILSETNVKNLISINALNEFNNSHAKLLSNLSFKETELAQFFDDVVGKKISNELSYAELKQNEKDALGFNLFFDNSLKIKELTQKNRLNTFNEAKKRRKTRVLCEILDVSEIKTKKGDKMAFLKISNGLETLSVTVFTNLYNKFLNLEKTNYYIIELSPNEYKNKLTFIAENIINYKKR